MVSLNKTISSHFQSIETDKVHDEQPEFLLDAKDSCKKNIYF